MWKIGFLVGRIIVGVYYAFSGIQHFIALGPMAEYTKSKGVPFPELGVIITGILLLVAGITILLGIYPKIGVISLVVFFIPVTFMMHNFWAVDDPMRRMAEMISFTKNMGLMGSALIFLGVPEPWEFSLQKRKS
jgi:uncharacterized membrane protein YphA (DoxX/SURF4 family)